jgi:hypothetical protein
LPVEQTVAGQLPVEQTVAGQLLTSVCSDRESNCQWLFRLIACF